MDKKNISGISKMVARSGEAESVGIPTPPDHHPRFTDRLFDSIDIAPLVYFRMLFGGIMFWEIIRYFSHDWIGRYYTEPRLFFPYYGFSWIHPLPENYMYVLFLVLAVLACFVFLGLWYRISILLFFLGFTYVFLLDQSNYLNHFYLIALLGFLMIFVPADRAASLDAIRRPELRSESAPAWTLWILRAQIGIAYFFGGIAKLSSDWLHGEPMRIWLHNRTDFPVIGQYFDEPMAAYFFSYSGLLIDLLIVPALLYRKTRIPAVITIVGFHLLNSQLFTIGIFPWFMLLATPIFFEPEKLRPVLRVEKVLGTINTGTPGQPVANRRNRVVLTMLSLFFGIQIIMPMRHLLYQGDVNWTEEGHRFAWHMKLRSKRGSLKLIATHPATGKSWTVNQEKYLSSRQRSSVKSHPDMIVQFSHYLQKIYEAKGRHGVEIRAKSRISLNGREYLPMIDSMLDLTKVKVSLGPAPWIVPLDAPLKIQKGSTIASIE